MIVSRAPTAFTSSVDPRDNVDIAVSYLNTARQMNTSVVSATVGGDADADADGVALAAPVVSDDMVRTRVTTANNPQNGRDYTTGHEYSVTFTVTMADGQQINDTYRLKVEFR